MHKFLVTSGFQQVKFCEIINIGVVLFRRDFSKKIENAVS